MKKYLYFLFIILIFIIIIYYFQKTERNVENYQELTTGISDHIISDHIISGHIISEHNNVSTVPTKLFTTILSSSFLSLLVICLCCSASIYFLTSQVNSNTNTNPTDNLPKTQYYILSEPKEIKMLDTLNSIKNTTP